MTLIRAARAAGHFKREILPVQAPILGADGTPTGDVRTVDSDQGIRDTSMEQLGALAPLIDWTSQMTGFWQSRFDKLEDLLRRMDQ